MPKLLDDLPKSVRFPMIGIGILLAFALAAGAVGFGIWGAIFLTMWLFNVVGWKALGILISVVVAYIICYRIGEEAVR